MRWLHFVLSHSIFVSVCAAALCYQTYVLLNLPPDNIVYLVVFSSTLCSYNAYWLLSKLYFSKTVSWIQFIRSHLSNVLLCSLSLLSLIVCLIYMPEVIKFLVIAGILTVLYTIPVWPGRILNPIFNLGFIKTVLLALTWTYVTIAVPAQVRIAEIDYPAVLLFLTRFLFMLMLCSIFDSRDSEVDKVHGLKSLATDVTGQALKIIMLTTFALYIITGIILRFELQSLAQTVAFIITGATVLIVYFLSLKKQGYIFYYFIVDGLMLFSAIATFLAAIV